MNGHSDRDWELSVYLRVRRLRDAVLRPISRVLAAGRVPPWGISLCGVGLAATLIRTLDRTPRLALIAFIGALACDAIDGAVARYQGSASATGKIVDHACDTATLLLALLAIHHHGLASTPQTVTCALLAAPLLLIAIRARRSRLDVEPVAGLWAHLFKVPIYGALLLYLAGSADFMEPAIKIANLSAIACLALLLARPRRPPAGASEILRG